MGFVASYNGDGGFEGFVFPFHGTTRPSSFTLFGSPRSLARKGTLVVAHSETGVTLTFPGCIHTGVSEMGSLTAYHFQDRRAAIQGLSYKAEWNIPFAGGPDLRQEKKPQDIAKKLLDLMEEDDYDVSELPNGPRPYLNGNGDKPGDVLDRLAHLLGCRVVLGLDNKFIIRRVGDGPAPSSLNVAHAPLSYTTSSHPESIAVDYAPTVFQSWLKLAPVTNAGNGLFPAAVNATPVAWIKDRDELRFYRIADTHPNPLNVPGHGDIKSIDEIMPLTTRKIEKLITPDRESLQFPKVRGKFHTGHYCGVTHSEVTLYNLPFKVHPDAGLVEFAQPVFKTDGAGKTEPCDQLFLEIAYHVRNPTTDGELERRIYGQAQDGDAARLEHRIQQKMHARYVAVYSPAGALIRVDDNLNDIDGMSDDLIEAAAPNFQEKTIKPQRHVGILSAEPGGVISQVVWAAGVISMDYQQAPVTWIGGDCFPYEFAAEYPPSPGGTEWA